MYIQVEGSLAFADEGRVGAESIVDYALSRDIIIATPGTMMALLRTAYLSWRQRNNAHKALELLEHVKTPLDRMKTFMAHYERTSKDLKDFVDTINKMAGSWNRQVYPQLERINDTRMDTVAVYEATKIDHDVPTVREIGSVRDEN